MIISLACVRYYLRWMLVRGTAACLAACSWRAPPFACVLVEVFSGHAVLGLRGGVSLSTPLGLTFRFLSFTFALVGCVFIRTALADHLPRLFICPSRGTGLLCERVP